MQQSVHGRLLASDRLGIGTGRRFDRGFVGRLVGAVVLQSALGFVIIGV